MRTGVILTATLWLGAASLVAGAGAADRSETHAGDASCSASSLPPGRPVAGLPGEVASMRLRLIAAARRCDYATLTRLSNEVGRGLGYSYGGDHSAARFWRTLERNGPGPRPLRALVKVLAMPFATVRADGGAASPNNARFYVWPSAHRLQPSEGDWRALGTLYPRAQIERMRRGGSGYLGYRVGITRNGDWQFFVAGD